MATNDSPLSVSALRVLSLDLSALAVFSDDFASNDLSKTQNGYGWAPSAGGVSVSGGQALLSFGPNAAGEDDTAQMNFDFPAPTSEIAVKFKLTIPANFDIRSNGKNTNNKLFQLNFDGSTFQALTIEYQYQATGKAHLRRFLSASETPAGEQNWPTDPQPIDDFLGVGCLMEPGNTYTIGVYYRASPDGTQNGRAELYVDGVLIRALDWPFWSVSTSGQINGGYVLGAANTGFDVLTEFPVDDFEIYTNTPEWT